MNQVHHITPARSDKNFGRAINQLIEHLPENDWICLRDIDSFPPDHVLFIKQCEQIANNPQGYFLIGCMTNRIGLTYQLVPNMYNEWDIRKHTEKARELASIKTIKPLTQMQTVGGVMMLFPKYTWQKIGGFPEGGVKIKGGYLDYHFSKSVKGKKGIAEGIYLYHNYRVDGKGDGHLI
jgi:hypothetical protein